MFRHNFHISIMTVSLKFVYGNTALSVLRFTSLDSLVGW